MTEDWVREGRSIGRQRLVEESQKGREKRIEADGDVDMTGGGETGDTCSGLRVVGFAGRTLLSVGV